MYRGARMRILIIDDSAVMRKIVENTLRHSGLELGEVLHAANGAEGLAVLETLTHPLDLILCDVHMPVMDGLGFLLERPRRNLAPGMPVVMITADESDPHLLDAIAAGAHGYISKPFTLEQMQTSVTALLNSAGHVYSSPVVPAPAPTQPAIGGAP
jgi:two-component system, chemotaxis family, chemotaxis protein CheY